MRRLILWKDNQSLLTEQAIKCYTNKAKSKAPNKNVTLIDRPMQQQFKEGLSMASASFSSVLPSIFLLSKHLAVAKHDGVYCGIKNY